MYDKRDAYFQKFVIYMRRLHSLFDIVSVCILFLSFYRNWNGLFYPNIQTKLSTLSKNDNQKKQINIFFMNLMNLVI